MQRLAMDKLKAWKVNPARKPLILRGARQVGKTSLLKHFGEAEFPNYHYINFKEDQQAEQVFERNLDPGRILNDLQLYLEKPIDPKTDLLIFDEIQRCPKALTSLKYFREKIPELALCAAGSLLGVYMSWDSFPVGQVTFLDLYPMTFEEFLSGTGKQQFVELLHEQTWNEPLPEIAHTKLWDLWKHYLITGGMPEAIKQYRKQQDNLLLVFQRVREIQRDLIDTYMADIAKHSGKANAMHIERLWRNVPAQLARSLDGSATKFKFKDAIPGYRGYERLAAPIDWLESAGLVLRTSIIDNAEIPLNGNTADNRFKLYLLDVGLLGAMNGMSPAVFIDFDFGRYKGYIAENFVAQELAAAGYQDLLCWEGRTSEVEFLIEADNQIVPIEVKSGHVTKSKSLKVYEERYQPQRSFVFSGNNVRISGLRSYVPLYAIGHVIRNI
ncbi:MAG: AAA family ATPase, partial [Candidatus Marinimicrobia bacterium]|nr:AAA family ATPase [Candidatus Neomarinimicrobiota bacterium]